MEGILIPIGKRIMTRVISDTVDILYDRGWYWKLEGKYYTPYQLKKITARPADDYAETLTVIEKGKFITLLNFKDFDSYTVVEGTTNDPDGVHTKLPKITKITDAYIDVYNRIFGSWKVASFLGDEEDIVEIIYNKYHQIAHYIIYKKDRTIILSPVASFEIIHPLGPKIIDIVKEKIITERGYDGFKLWPATNAIIDQINSMIGIAKGENNQLKDSTQPEVEEKIRKRAAKILQHFRQKAETIPISNSAKNSKDLVPFIDGKEPVYASPFGFYRGDPPEFEPEKAARSLEKILEPTEYANGSFEFKLFDDYTYAIKYDNYVLLPCGLAKLDGELSILDYDDPRDIAYRIQQIGYKYATKPVENYTTEMRFDVPGFLE